MPVVRRPGARPAFLALALTSMLLLAAGAPGASSPAEAQVPPEQQASVAARLPTPQPGGFTYGRAGTSDLASLAAAQRFPVEAVFLIDPEGDYLVYRPSAPAWANTLTADRLHPASLVVLRRALGGPSGSMFERAQVVSFYGYPGIASMGELGEHSPERAADLVAQAAAEYAAAGGGEVIPAFHLIIAVAQPQPGADGTYLYRMPRALLEQYVELARDRGMQVFLDVQIGHSDPLSEVQLVEWALQEPFVHVALDPEFDTRADAAARTPGQVIGRLAESDVDAVQGYLGGLVRQHGLPPKALVLHQFMEDMLPNPVYDDVPEVEIVIDMDGFGDRNAKLSKYEAFALGPYAERAGIKLFYDWDIDLLLPSELQALPTPPDLVIYQ
ncbi:MAG: hypothetical protein GEU80_11165 [Dehalococcoidia bacterium]|nr:hypothetical protein [Dehalococcoidia bacterium]